MTLPVLSVQAVVVASWVGPTVAVSLVFIALSFATIAIVAALTARGAVEALHKLSQELAELRGEMEPALRSVRETVEEGRGVASSVREELQEVVRTSRRVRHDVERGIGKAKRRLADLDALAEVMQDELEDTALDVAAKLRSVRTGLGMASRVRRLLRRRRG